MGQEGQEIAGGRHGLVRPAEWEQQVYVPSEEPPAGRALGKMVEDRHDGEFYK